jgi:CRISPR-associated protein Csm2
MKYLLTFFMAALCLTACNKDDEPNTDPVDPTTDSRTVILYMSGENDLSSYVTSDTAEVVRGSIDLKTNQIRKVLTAVNSLTGRIDVYKAKNGQTDVLPDDLAAEVKYLKVKLVYQAGRDSSRDNQVKTFVEKSGLLQRIDSIGTSISKYEDFARYLEALVAYHKFYGGKDK